MIFPVSALSRNRCCGRRWYEDNVLGEPINALAAKGEDVYLFFDELQNLPAWEAQLKFLADNRAARMIATGSSALRIGQGQDSLAGRLSLIELGTLRLREIAGIRKEREFPPYQNNGSVEDWTRLEFWRDFQKFATSQASAIRGVFKHFSDLGGYPICHKTKRADASDLADLIVSMVVERTLLRDLKAGQLGSRRDQRVVEETFRRVCRYAGQSVQPARIQQELDAVLQSGVSLNAVVDALQFLEDSMLVRHISRWRPC